MDEQLRSIGGQAKYLIDIVIRHPGWIYQGVFIDICTDSRSDKRTELQRMLTECRAGLIDMVLVRTVSGLGRNTLDTLNIIRELKDLGIEVLFADDSISTMAVEGELLLTLLAAFAQEDNRNRRMNVLWGVQKRLKDGTSVLYKRKCYGYDTGKEGEMTINEEAARVVRFLYKSYLAGNSICYIQKQLEEKGIPSPLGSARRALRSIDSLLSNEKYYGAVCVGKSYLPDIPGAKPVKNNGERELYWWHDHHEAIISKEEFVAVQEEKKRRSSYEHDENGERRRKSNRYISINTDVEF